MGLMLVFTFSDVCSSIILRTHRREIQWRTGAGRGNSNANTCLYNLCKQLFDSFRDMGYDKPTCRPEFETYNGVVSAVEVYVGEILDNTEAEPLLTKYAHQLH